MTLDRSTIRETGSSDLKRVRPAGDFDGTTRRDAMKALLAKHAAVEDSTALWSWLSQVFKVAAILLFLAGTASAQMHSAYPPLTPREAADVMQRLADHDKRPALLEGPRVLVIPSTPGALSWLTFPPERERLRLDGTPLTQPATVYGFNPFPVLTFRGDRRGK